MGTAASCPGRAAPGGVGSWGGTGQGQRLVVPPKTGRKTFLLVKQGWRRCCKEGYGLGETRGGDSGHIPLPGGLWGPPSDEGDAGAGGVHLQHIELLVLPQRRLDLGRGEALGQAALQGLGVGHGAAPAPRQLPHRSKDGVGRALRPGGGRWRGVRGLPQRCPPSSWRVQGGCRPPPPRAPPLTCSAAPCPPAASPSTSPSASWLRSRPPSPPRPPAAAAPAERGCRHQVGPPQRSPWPPLTAPGGPQRSSLSQGAPETTGSPPR